MSEAIDLDILVVSAHPDDAELSVGGLIAASRLQGLKVGVLDLTDGEPTPYGSLEIRARETAVATSILNLSWRENLGLKNRNLRDTDEARLAVASVFRRTRPKLILSHYWEDAHPDHVAASALVDAGRFWSKLSKSDIPGERYHPPKILYYLSIHMRNQPKPSFVFDISNVIDQKLDSVRAYESQVIQGRPTEYPTVIDDVKDRARYWGWTIGTTYAEPLFSKEEIGIRDIKHLI
jgi:bacillithiol biosynthesis deacetylase BshB1